ncbi:MAG: hypothetical protein IKN54_07310 [Lachnospiraceae bacterium]|nr:hypothetical protein [Lachnospiraceae bacterium]
MRTVEKVCGECKWCHKEQVGEDWDMICVNGDSDYCADFVEWNHSCEEFEEKD